MNTSIIATLSTTNRTAVNAAVLSTGNVVRIGAELRRPRDFGVGYGNSSGYASSKRYTTTSVPSRFRCA